MTTGDEELLARIRNGAPDDFAEIVRRHQSHVFAILHRYESDSHRLEDLAQETFVKAWRSLDRFDGRVPFQHWLSRIAVTEHPLPTFASGEQVAEPAPASSRDEGR